MPQITYPKCSSWGRLSKSYACHTVITGGLEMLGGHGGKSDGPGPASEAFMHTGKGRARGCTLNITTWPGPSGSVLLAPWSLALVSATQISHVNASINS